MSTGDQGLQDLARGLVNYDIEELDLSRNIHSVSELRSLGTLCRRTRSMRSLDLSRSSINDEGLQSFVEGMAYCCNLTLLNLSHNPSVTANGLASLSSLLEHCSLCTLDLFGINIGDDEAAVLANGLIGNKSLTNLKFDVSNSGITARGWAAFSRLLCDTSSVNNTYLSNHTLVEVGEPAIYENAIPRDIKQVLKLNKSLKQSAAISKILHSHPDIDVTPLFQWEMKCLPLVVAWFEKAKSYLDNVNESTESFQRRQLSTVYKFVRGMPLLAANGYRSQKMKDQSEEKKKRKFDLTL